MRKRWVILFSVLTGLGASGSAPAWERGAWSTLIRAYTYRDLLAEGDTVWCATGEAGLLRYQPSDSSFIAINREPGGLASNSLTTLLRDRSGRLWVGTLGAGASRLSADGTKWDVVNRFDGLPSDSVTAFAARGDSLLIGTPRGIALWTGTEIQGALPDGFNPSPFTNGSDWMTGIAIHGDSAWVCTRLGVYRSQFSQGLTTWTSEAGIESFAFENIVTDDTTLIALWGNAPLSHAFETPGPWSLATNVAGGGTIPNAVRIYQDQGKLLLTTEQGFFVWNSNMKYWVKVTNQFASVRNDDHRSFALTVDRNGRFFAAEQDGLRERVGNPDLWTLRAPAGPPGNDILNLALDGKRLWVNTFAEGIGRLDDRGWRNWPFDVRCAPGCDTTLYAPNYAFALLVDRRSKKWFGCWGTVIDVYDDSLPTPHVTHHLYQPDDVLPDGGRYTCAWASAADSSGGRWFGMDTNNRDVCCPARGLHYFDLGGNLFQAFTPDSSSVRDNIVRALTVDRSGRLWVGYLTKGIDYFDLIPNRPDSLPQPHTVAGTERLGVAGLVARGDTVWAFHGTELVAYRRTNGDRIVSYSLGAGVGQGAVNPLAVGRDGTVWVGTTNGIREVVPGSGSVQAFDLLNSPLASEDVRAIQVEPSGVVWIGTSLGLNRYDPGYRPPPPPPVPQLKVTVYPNPAWLSSIGIGIKLTGNATSYSGEIYDLQGRRLRRFSGVGNQGFVWDGYTEQGHLARPGIYFLRVQSGGKSASSRLILLR